MTPGRRYDDYPSDIEKRNLEAHVEICHQRYRNIESRLQKIEDKVGSIHKEIVQGNKGLSKVLITTAGTVVAGVLSTLIVVIIAFL